ncbi:MAG: hypothetical protein IJD11_02550 [Oscillospiraceae bacterium]|nr:hypothetical protein [Oscillospiraceae bacterium]
MKKEMKLMERSTKIGLGILASILILALSVTVIHKYGWRLFGYYFCEDPEYTALYVKEEDDQLHFWYANMDLGHSLDSYRPYHVEEDTLYLGVNSLFLVGDYYSMFQIDPKRKINKIILCGRGKERVIYDRSVDGDRHEFQKGD